MTGLYQSSSRADAHDPSMSKPKSLDHKQMYSILQLQSGMLAKLSVARGTRGPGRNTTVSNDSVQPGNLNEADSGTGLKESDLH